MKKKILLGILLFSYAYISAQTTNGVFTVRTVKSELAEAHGADDNLTRMWKELENQINGSGFLINYKGNSYLITCAHVVKNASYMFGKIIAKDINDNLYNMEFIGADTYYDIAVLSFKKDEVKPKLIHALNFSTSPPKQFETVESHGTALNGVFEKQALNGKITAKEIKMNKKHPWGYGFFTTNMQLYPGMSGGPTINEDGKIIGINIGKSSAGRYSDQFLGIHLNAMIAQKIISDIINNEDHRVSRVFTGIIFQQETNNNSSFVIVSDVLKNSPAYSLFNELKDCTITKINYKKIYNLNDIINVLENAHIGKDISISVEKNGKESILNIPTKRLEERHLNLIVNHYFKTNPNYYIQEGNKNFHLHRRSCSLHKEYSDNVTCYNSLEFNLARLEQIPNTSYLTEQKEDLGKIIRLATPYGGFFIKLNRTKKGFVYNNDTIRNMSTIIKKLYF